MSESFDTLLRLAALSRSAADEDLRELDRGLDELDDGDVPLLFFALAVLRSTNTPERYRKFRACLCNARGG